MIKMIAPINNLETIVSVHPDTFFFRRAEKWEIPDIDLSLWEGNSKAACKIALAHLIDFLHMPYIFDKHECRTTREDWIGIMEEKHPGFEDFYNNNAISYGHLYAISIGIQSLRQEYSGTNHEILKELESQITSSIPGSEVYRGMTRTQKYLTVSKLKKQVNNALRFLSIQSRRLEQAASYSNSA